MKSIETIRKELEKRRAEASLGGGQERIDKQHQDGKLTTRERIDLLFDPCDLKPEKGIPYGFIGGKVPIDCYHGLRMDPPPTEIWTH